MRPGQNNKRMRGRPNNNRKGPNPLTRSYESNGPDVKIRGTAHHIGEKYLQLARDAQSSGDPVTAESYLQHAEHYFRIIAQAQAQMQGGFSRQSGEPAVEEYDADDDFAAIPDRFASPLERVQAAQPNFAPPGAGPQPSTERAYFPGQQDRQQQGQRSYQDRQGQDRPQGQDRQDRSGEQRGYPDRANGQDRTQERAQERFGQEGRSEPARQLEPRADRGPREADARRQSRSRDFRSDLPRDDAGAAPGLPAFITAPAPRPSEAPAESFEPSGATLDAFAPQSEERAEADREPAGFHLRPRRRRRTKAEMGAGEASEGVEARGGERDPVGD
ncbi:DUF4167 domain-containing protein [Methylocella sp.]|uniref:DUF4167 domain-containing protein n=1 Tax=Methylocella sp. TaxID=1978226 RepID=UPI0035AFFF95